jgi:hypothetical protein
MCGADFAFCDWIATALFFSWLRGVELPREASRGNLRCARCLSLRFFLTGAHFGGD